MQSPHPTDLFLDKVHSIMAARGIGWDESWSLARTLYPSVYGLMKEAGKPRQQREFENAQRQRAEDQRKRDQRYAIANAEPGKSR